MNLAELGKEWAVRFWSNVAFADGDDCWLWQKSVQSAGYGAYGVRSKVRLAHRIAFELANGPIPSGKVLDHLCRNPRCVRPDHLEVVDQRTNMLRGVGPQARARRTGKCKRGHEFTSGKPCRVCGTDRQRARRLAAKAVSA
ncbi:MAG: HNH endonuclease signature motif containing protein [Planctomycetota bacterium]